MKILVVDDSTLMRKLILRALGGADLEVVEAADGVEALAMIQCHDSSIDLVICDMNMPHLNDLSLLRSLRSSKGFRQTPFVIVTADESDESTRQALREGANEVIRKPFQPEVMAALIDRYAASSKCITPAAPRDDPWRPGLGDRPGRN